MKWKVLTTAVWVLWFVGLYAVWVWALRQGTIVIMAEGSRVEAMGWGIAAGMAVGVCLMGIVDRLLESDLFKDKLEGRPAPEQQG
jgi:hypothetical protein